MTVQRLLVFTDLDGTLLDHNTYQWQAAAPALNRLAQANIPVIFNSSKTQAELQALRHELANPHPFIVENGGAVCVPEGYFVPFTGSEEPNAVHLVCFGRHYTELVEILSQLRAQHGWQFRSFHDLSEESVAALTGLTVARATQAKQRVCSEPLLWEDEASAFAAFQAALAAHNLRLVQGGRFFHVLDQFDKAEAIQWLIQQYQQAYPDHTLFTIGLGDGPNDQRMLEQVDIAVVIKAHHHNTVTLNSNNEIIYTEAYGPEGWQAAINMLLDRLGYHS